jgi:hypothetical protein
MTPGRVPHPSVEERAARGKAARAKVPRSSHAAWEPSRERRRAEDVLLEQAASRVAELVPIRHGRMLARGRYRSCLRRSRICVIASQTRKATTGTK